VEREKERKRERDKQKGTGKGKETDYEIIQTQGTKWKYLQHGIERFLHSGVILALSMPRDCACHGDRKEAYDDGRDRNTEIWVGWVGDKEQGERWGWKMERMIILCSWVA
jgi:hypothetical protein